MVMCFHSFWFLVRQNIMAGNMWTKAAHLMADRRQRELEEVAGKKMYLPIAQHQGPTPFS
jgi:hypothetical protein